MLIAVAAGSLVEPSGEDEAVTLTQFRTLVVLASQGETKLVALADRLDVTPSTAQRMVERLLRAGLVSREPNPDNRREVLLALTPDGQALVRRVTRRRRRALSEIAAGMPEESRVGFVTALEAFSDAAGEPPVQPASDTW